MLYTRLSFVLSTAVLQLGGLGDWPSTYVQALQSEERSSIRHANEDAQYTRRTYDGINRINGTHTVHTTQVTEPVDDVHSSSDIEAFLARSTDEFGCEVLRMETMLATWGGELESAAMRKRERRDLERMCVEWRGVRLRPVGEDECFGDGLGMNLMVEMWSGNRGIGVRRLYSW
jgi:hypothetical protein